MKIRRASIFDPELNTAYVVPAFVLSMLVFAYSVRLGPLSILAFYGCWLFPFALAPQTLMNRPAPVIVLMALPFLFLLSTLWSDAPVTTLRASLQYAITVFAGLVAARIMSVGNLVLGGTIGSLLILLFSAANGGYSYDYIDGDFAFNGAFASKNQLGYFATLAVLFPMALVVAFRAPRAALVLSAVTAALGLVMLWLSDSATSMLSALAAFTAMLFVGFVMYLAPWLRRATVLVAGMGFAALLLAAYQLGAFDAVLSAFGKDTTLTGRTYLWGTAFDFAAERPVLGLGYNAFWVHGRPEAESLWSAFYITARTGFHFHNALIETYVGTGFVGLALVSGVCALLIIMPVSAALGRGGVGSLMFFAGLAVLFVLRSAAEVDFVTPHTVGSFLVAFILLRLFDHHRDVRRSAHLSRPLRSGRHPSLGAHQGVFE